MKPRRIKGAIFILLPIAALLMFSSCYYDYGLDETNLDVVSTFYDQGYNFSQVNTYFMPDSVVHASSDPGTYDSQILSKLQEELNALGWTRLYPGGTDTADVVVLVGATTQLQTITYYNDWWSYWGWYGGWGYYPTYGYGSGWGWYYPSYTTTYTYQTGTILITLTDPTTGDPATQQLPVQWLCLVNGLLDGSSISTRINTTLTQAFNQSPYLNQ
jgi:hypothetical protein